MLDGMIENYDAVLEKYISSFDDNIKTEWDEYERRIKLCDDCSQLLNGICRLCGCFVKARVAKKIMGCPSTPPMWRRLE